MSARDFWINQAFFQLSWPACVIGAANGMLWPGALVVGLFAMWQLHPARRMQLPHREQSDDQRAGPQHPVGRADHTGRPTQLEERLIDPEIACAHAPAPEISTGVSAAREVFR